MVGKWKKHRVLLIVITISVAIIVSIIGYLIYEDKKIEQSFLEKFKNGKKDFEIIKIVILDDVGDNFSNVSYSVTYSERIINSYYLSNEGEFTEKKREGLVLTEDQLNALKSIKKDFFLYNMDSIDFYKSQIFFGSTVESYVYSYDGSEPNKTHPGFKDYEHITTKLDPNWYHMRWLKKYGY